MRRLSVGEALRQHWPEYLIEAWALGMFMVSAGLVGVLLEAPGSALRAALPDPDLRRALAGVAMGCTAVALIYSPWGQRSGAHMNPAVTATYYLLGKVRGVDALGYAAAQFAGGLAGVALVAAAAGAAFVRPPVQYVATRPGAAGAGVAFLAEVAISALMMTTILAVSKRPRLARYTGVCAGLLVATFITLEAPLSGMSMNPARSFASAAPAGLWRDLWLYFAAPLLGMSLAAALHRLAPAGARVPCAKLQHPADVRCIHCGHQPARAAATAVPHGTELHP
jgi:aquaporin Z